jgi:peptide/nickel transport system ATP-binding protein
MPDTVHPLLEITNLHTKFETDAGTVPAVEGISFTVTEGEIFGIVGESGSGKSVTARSIMGLLESNGVAEADAMQFKGIDLLELSDTELNQIRGSKIGMIFQDPMSGLNPVMSIGEQIAEVVRHHGDTGESTGFWSEMRRKYVTGTNTSSPSWKRAVELLDTVGIPDPEVRATEYPHQLSGGMKQRVMIAQALAGDPSLIIADEPTTALDVTIEAQILSELLELRDEFDVSVILITHDLAVIREVCDRVAVMYAGELMEQASTPELFNNPTHPYTRGLLQSIPQANDQSGTLDAIPGQVPDPRNKPVGCPFSDRCPRAFEKCDQDLVAYTPAISSESETDVITETNSDTTMTHSVFCHLYNPCVHTDDDGNVTQIEEEFNEAVAAQRIHTDDAADQHRPHSSTNTSTPEASSDD